MAEQHLEIEREFLQYVKKMTAYEEALSLIYWDLRTGAPKNGVSRRSQVIGMLSSEVFNMSTSEEMAAFIASLAPHASNLSKETRRILEVSKEEYERNKKIPAHEYEEFVVLKSEAEHVWETAREKSDFSLFQPYLEKLVDFTKRFLRYWGYDAHPYDTLLDQYEPGVTVQLVDKVFGELRDAIVPLVKKIQEEGKEPETSFLFGHFPKKTQIDFSVELLKGMGYDFDSGRLDESVHPFAIGLNPGDVRITTRYDENDFRMAIFGTIHEGGHALYEQNISKQLFGTPLCTGTSMGIHESQSLFYENIVARDRNYWVHNYPLLKKYAPDQFADVSLDDFYRAINEAKPSLIRIEADDLTYALHIIIRYEIEKALFSDEIEVTDLPRIWNDKYEQYLGIRPENDGEGVLQDIHWSSGDFGYFPSYALGYMYAAQLKNAMVKDLPNYDQLLKEGDLQPVKQWLNEKVHVYGRLKKPLEIIEAATGEGLNASHLIEYLKAKFSNVYQLDRA